jgi:hypothetical protein
MTRPSPSSPSRGAKGALSEVNLFVNLALCPQPKKALSQDLFAGENFGSKTTGNQFSGHIGFQLPFSEFFDINQCKHLLQ